MEANDVDVNNFTLGNPREYPEGVSYTILYENRRFYLKIRDVLLPYGVTPYQTKYSSGYSCVIRPQGEVLALLDRMDRYFESMEVGVNYKKLVHRRADYLPQIRARVSEKFIDISYAEPGERYTVVLQIMPMWVKEATHGISWRLMQIE